jgi:hypothetical protein
VLLQTGEIGCARIPAWTRRLFAGQLHQFLGIREIVVHVTEGEHDLFQAGAFAAEFLGTLRIVPDVGLLQFAVYLFQTFAFAGVVKDTPSGSRRGP